MKGHAKVFSSIIASSVWAESPETCKVWITMLAVSGPDGIVEASIGGLARMAVVSREAAETALHKLSSPDPDDRSGIDEGRRIRKVRGGWQIINHAHYREKNSSTERMRRLREKEKADVTSVTVTSRDDSDGSEAEAEAEAIDLIPSTATQSRDESKPVKRGVESWVPDEAKILKWRTEKGYPTELVSECIEAMRDWAIANGKRKVDWLATLRAWVKREAARRRLNARGAAAPVNRAQAQLNMVSAQVARYREEDRDDQ